MVCALSTMAETLLAMKSRMKPQKEHKKAHRGARLSFTASVISTRRVKPMLPPRLSMARRKKTDAKHAKTPQRTKSSTDGTHPACAKTVPMESIAGPVMLFTSRHSEPTHPMVLPPPKPSPRLNIDATVFERPSLVRRLSISDELPPGALEYFSLDRVADRVDERPDSDISSLG